jgi:ABC-2 type transport system permease protein
LSYLFPLTYGADLLKYGINDAGTLPVWLNFLAILGFCIVLFFVSLRNIYKRWIL